MSRQGIPIVIFFQRLMHLFGGAQTYLKNLTVKMRMSLKWQQKHVRDLLRSSSPTVLCGFKRKKKPVFISTVQTTVKKPFGKMSVLYVQLKWPPNERLVHGCICFWHENTMSVFGDGGCWCQPIIGSPWMGEKKHLHWNETAVACSCLAATLLRAPWPSPAWRLVGNQLVQASPVHSSACFFVDNPLP